MDESSAQQALKPYSAYLKPRPRIWHKGQSGHLLVVGGDKGFVGAACMAAEAALRVGAGLVTVVTHIDHVTMLTMRRPEIMSVAFESRNTLMPLLAKAKALVLGPGLGQSAWSQVVFESCIDSSLPMLVDADGLNSLAGRHHYNDAWVLTPHPAEAGRLLGVATSTIQEDREHAVMAIQKRYGGVAVLKGAGSLVMGLKSSPLYCPFGNPGMATAGMGDVLSGVIGGLLAQSIPLAEAAELGVLLHALAGDEAAKQEGERGMMATDLYPYLRQLVNLSWD